MKVNTVKADPSEFLEELRKEETVAVVQQERKVEKTRVVETTEEVQVTSQKHEIEYYKGIVAKEEAKNRFNSHS